METIPIQTISIARLRQEALLSQLSLYELGQSAMNQADILRAQALRSTIIAAAMQTTVSQV